MAEDMPESLQRLDLRGLRCPLPVLRIEALARRLSPGTRLQVLADDPIARVDIPHAMTQAGHACREIETPQSQGDHCVFEVTLAGKG